MIVSLFLLNWETAILSPYLVNDIVYMDGIFLDFIRFAIGACNSFSQPLSAEEWRKLYHMAVKHSLIGICFVGVRRYKETAKQRGDKKTILEETYYQWLGAVAQIIRRNDLMKQRCMELQFKLSSFGLNSSILKGQSAADLYGELKDFRQSGDIDVWIHPVESDSLDCHFKRVMKSVSSYKTKNFNRQHAEVQFFNDAVVEVHFTPSIMNNPYIIDVCKNGLGNILKWTMNSMWYIRYNIVTIIFYLRV